MNYLVPQPNNPVSVFNFKFGIFFKNSVCCFTNNFQISFNSSFYKSIGLIIFERFVSLIKE